MSDTLEDDLHTRQEEEVEVLQSIFGDDFEDIRKNDKWKVPRPPEILLHLRPLHSMSGNSEIHASIDLRANFSSDYPHKIPELKLENSKGLCDEVIKSLSKDLHQEAEKNIGEVMMLQLSQLVQEVLHKYNKPTLSIYEENMKFKNEQLEKNKRKSEEQMKKKLDYQWRELEEERIRRKEEERNLKLDRQKKRDRSADSVTVRKHLDSGGSTGFDISQSPSSPVSKIVFNTKTQRIVYKGKCIGKSGDGCIVHIGLEKESGNPVAIQEWIIPYPGSKKLKTSIDMSKVAKYTKIIKGMEQEFHSLLKLSHTNLISYLAIRYVEERDHIHVDILQEYVPGRSLEAKIAGNEHASLSEVRATAEHLLHALDYLHSHSVVHKNLKASAVIVDSRGVARLADFSIEKRLADLYKESHIEQPGVTFVDDTIPSKNSKKGDILNLGMLVLSMALGRHVKDFPPDIPSKFPSVFKDFLKKCLAVEDRIRLNASELLDHGFLKIAVSGSPESPSEAKAGSCANGVAEEDSNASNAPDLRGRDLVIYPQQPQMLSRLRSEFQEIQWLGKGGFGDVVQVKNQLDGRYYAIKRILLDPRRSQFNKKITREVKLLSRLNHENVVRYYNSWIETLLNPDDTSTEATSSMQSLSKPSEAYINSLGMIDDIENNAPPPATHSYSDWASVDNYSFKQEESDDDEDDEENDLFVDIFEPEDEEESVMFDEDEQGEKKVANGMARHSHCTANETTSDESSLGNVPKQYLYIQMEFCEKSTLREAINEGLDDKRMWCLFREILDGLVHIHDQGMIHRDLKPQNIFLDADNHIKIGDFGLATSHTDGMIDGSILMDLASSKSEGGDSAMTGRIGTALYVAPELNKGSRMSYDQKVDIYSLGIIFFEMCYKGLQTKMERVKVLGNLRLEEIKFPDNFDDSKKREKDIIKWCLKHAPAKRPTADELLKSSLLPAPEFEKSNPVVKYVRQALEAPHSSQQHHLMLELFSANDKKMDDVFYDVDQQKGQFLPTQQLMQEKIHTSVISIMRRHGAVRVNPPLLLPRQQIIENNDEWEDDSPLKELEYPTTATFMDSFGTIVTLPHDLRTPFARYVSRKGITNLRRYAVEKVFRKAKIHRSHPRELWECAFDIVTPTVCNLIPEAEGISVVSEIIAAFPVLTKRSYKITLNHTVLLLAILEHSGIPINKHNDVKRVLIEGRSEKLSKTQLEARLFDLSLSSQQVSTLFTFIYQQGPLSKIQTLLKNLTRNKHSQISMHARQGLHELDALRKNLDSFSVNLPIIVHLGFVHNLHQFSGIIFQVSAEIVKKKRTSNEVIAAGGRYDDLIERFQIPQMNHAAASFNRDDSTNHSKKAHAFGVSIAIDRIITLALSEFQQINEFAVNIDSFSPADSSLLSNVDALVAVIGRNQLFHERMKILRYLWDAGIRAEMTLEGGGSETDSLEMLQEKAVKLSIMYLIILKDRSSYVKVRTYDQLHSFSRHNETELQVENLVEYLLRKMKGGDDNIPKHCTDYGGQASTLSLESSTTGSAALTIQGSRRLNIDVLAPDKLAYNHKRRYEQQALTRLMSLPILQHISGKAEIYGLAVDLPSSALKTFVQGVDMGQEENFNTSVAAVASQLPKYKKYFGAIAEAICEARFQKEVALIILYSYKDDLYRLLS